MFKKLDDVAKKYDELNALLATPEVATDHKRMIEYNKAINDMEEIVLKYREYKGYLEELEFIKENLKDEKDEEMKEMMLEEKSEIEEKLPEMEEDMKILLLPKDPNDDKNVIVEIRGGAGGDEAALFAGDIFRMYSRYAERRKWKIEIMDKNEIGVGGLKEIIFLIKGQGAYSRLKFESGVHRVQRVPATEASGRIHTSTITVAILPEIDDVAQVDIKTSDLKIDTYRSGGSGGQHVNTTDSAVRITHIPTGTIVQCQDGRSQLKNREQAMKILAAKIFEAEVEKQRSEVEGDRKLQVGTGARSEKIRTYNFPQGRVTDHRIKLTLHRLDYILDGDLDEIIDGLITFDQADQLQSMVD
ncbi:MULTISPECIES: peptide chain release factor 1 [Psychrilyobacter]|uniref:Peptide chain release factor 1 n=1 Tax=Psychrilyobacter piezotolerans TaxID=2293438 RepID=A0ABX9KH67_9FUSO|nr:MULTISPECIES: peptide chain release factor 1 [Psychrilyobacter]MCS5420335.1 peptide chain release factor 1 [Psychrilyobacter sp. S5]NDI78083.1 peptide chain release factor 1 [Psychrilyobacter piezotolerans]RDE61674.1 peptide chain release factor 1 [Psychrilyobacter sp. S5]REI41066.1 peptide chain release factor 1 [Psychrilyobacter piezotolerans]